MTSAARHAARAGAAAFLLGVSLTAAPPIALADDIDTGTTGPGAAAAPSAPPATARASRGAAATARPAVTQRLGLPRPAAAQAAPTAAQRDSDFPTVAKIRPPRRGPGPVRPQTPAEPARNPAPAISGPADQPQSEQLTTVPAGPLRAPSAARSAAAIADTTVGLPPAGPAPVALAGLTAAAGTDAVTSVAELLSGLLAPIREVFEGIALLVRRTFFNQAPILSPIQLTGQGGGPITGTVGAVDPEGDPIVYSITQVPRYGSAVVTADGGYTYTPGPDFTGTDSFIVDAADTGFHLNLFDLFRPAGTAANVSVAQGAPATRVTFQFVYGAGSQHWSSAARSALEYVAATLASSLVVSAPVTVTYAVTGEFSPFSSTLASAGSDLVSSDPGFLRTVVQEKILSGTDANGAVADGTISWNFGPGWGLGDLVPGSQYDFQSTAMHELLHTVGFLSNVVEPGANIGESWTVYDSYLVTATGTAVIGGDFTWNTAYNPNLTGGNGGLYFGGPNAVAAYGGLVPLFTPSPWDPGSSLSHLDDLTFTGSDEKLMNAQSGRGLGIRVISPVEVAILEDLGYTVVPGTGAAVWALVGVVFLRRTRRRD